MVGRRHRRVQGRTTHQRRREDGAAAVEFALVLPILLLLVFGIIGYGYMLSFRQSISHYYYAQFLGTLFVGMLVFIGGFLIAYTG